MWNQSIRCCRPGARSSSAVVRQPRLSPMRVDHLTLAHGRDVMFGRPATPIAPEPTAAIAGAVAQCAGVREAHLPQCFMPGVSEAPAQVLFVVLERGVTGDTLMAELGPRLHGIVPSGVFLDVLPVQPTDSLLPAIRNAGCEIFRAPPRAPWWKWW